MGQALESAVNELCEMAVEHSVHWVKRCLEWKIW